MNRLIIARRRLWTPQDRNDTPRGRLFVDLYDGDVRRGADGRIVTPHLEHLEHDNLIVTAGKTLMLQRLGASAVAAVTYGGVGTDSTAAAVGQTQLNPSVAGTVYLQAADSGYPVVSSTTETWQFTLSTSSANIAIVEFAVFNGSTNGTSTMFNRLTFGAINKTSAIAAVFTYQLQQS